MPKMDFITKSAALLSLVYVGLSPLIARPLYRSLLFRPAKHPEGNYDIDTINGITKKDVQFNSADGTELHGWFFPNPSSSKTLLYHHGNGANLSVRPGMIELMLQAGLSVLIYDYRGYGLSKGVPSPRGVCDDGCAAFDYLVNAEGLAPEGIINYGESLGAAVACQVSTVRHGAALILQSGFSSLRNIGGQVAPITRIYPRWLYPRPELDNIKIVKHHHPPLLIIHGENDVVVPISHAEELFAKAARPKEFVRLPNAGHSDIAMTDPIMFQQALSAFLSSLP